MATGTGNDGQGTPVVVHDAAAARFSSMVEGQGCELDYVVVDGVMTITHTGVPPAVGGRGIAGRLVQAALAHARAQGWKVVPACSYAAAQAAEACRSQSSPRRVVR